MPRDTFFNLPEEKRARIMEEALDEFAAHPYGRASISQIARRARISKGAFYLYFRDKFDLYIYLLELGAEKKLEVLKEAVAPLEAEPDFLRVWRRIMEASMEFARDNPRLWAISNHLRRESDQDLLERVMARLAPQGEEFMGDWLLRSQEAGYVSLNFRGRFAYSRLPVK